MFKLLIKAIIKEDIFLHFVCSYILWNSDNSSKDLTNLGLNTTVNNIWTYSSVPNRQGETFILFGIYPTPTQAY